MDSADTNTNSISGPEPPSQSKRTATDPLALPSPPSKRPSGRRRSPATTDLDLSVAQVGLPGDANILELDEFDLAAAPSGTNTPNAAGTSLSHRERNHAARHQAVVPADLAYKPLAEHVPPIEPAKTFPFPLDPFQSVSLACIQRHESVLVSAHTSAGKTVVAEYAIAHCLKAKQRIIYTSPIKSLSNQKYRDFSSEFGDVGLITGDVTINPSASCLVMTTEVLRSMLYHGSEIVREVAWVVFDEIHYLKDEQRGVVWEETIILLPRQVRYVFLSATVPNALQFAQWIAHLHHQICHVVSTNWRPTPLQYYVYPQSADGLYLVLDEQGAFQETNFRHAMDTLRLQSSGRRRRHGSHNDGPSDMYKLVKMLMTKRCDPVIVFAFSQRECEVLAMQLAKMDLSSSEEKDSINTVFTNAVSILSSTDQGLPQIRYLLPLLRRGIGIHHGGLLPLLREIIEILFQEGLIKVLFATETFSIGLNMPAKTVVFTSVRKWDGKQFRCLTSGEMIQMSGRAGRRGLDERGMVIMMLDEALSRETAMDMICGEADRLESAFHLSYPMVINLLRTEGTSPEAMLQRSFADFQLRARTARLEHDLRAAQATARAILVPNEHILADLDRVQQQLDLLDADRVAVIHHPSYALPFLQAGRVVRVQVGELDFGWGVVVAFEKRRAPRSRDKVAEYERMRLDPQHAAEGYIVDLLLFVSTFHQAGPSTSRSPGSGIRPGTKGEGEMVVIPALLSCIRDISAVRITLPRDLRAREKREEVSRVLAEVAGMEGGGALLDPVKDMKITDEAFSTLLSKMALLRARQDELRARLERAASSEPNRGGVVAQWEGLYRAKRAAEAQVEALAAQGGRARTAVQLAELRARLRTLRRLGHVTQTGAVQHKGRLACQILAADSLLLTELLFQGLFRGLDPALCAALVSCFLVEGTRASSRSSSSSGVGLGLELSEREGRKLPEQLREAVRVLRDTARRVERVSRESGSEAELPVLRLDLVECVLGWCEGQSFAEVVKCADQQEGSLVRSFRRLAELLRQLADAAQTVGNEELVDLFRRSRQLLERPNSIIFSPSLYL